jgi:hypothetical protein
MEKSWNFKWEKVYEPWRDVRGWPVYRPKFPYVSKCAYMKIVNGFIRIEFITAMASYNA